MKLYSRVVVVLAVSILLGRGAQAFDVTISANPPKDFYYVDIAITPKFFLPLTATADDPNALAHYESQAETNSLNYWWSGEGVNLIDAPSTTLTKEFSAQDIGITNNIPISCFVTSLATDDTGEGQLDVKVIIVECPIAVFLILNPENADMLPVPPGAAISLWAKPQRLKDKKTQDYLYPQNSGATWKGDGLLPQGIGWSKVWRAPQTHKCTYEISVTVTTDGCDDVLNKASFKTFSESTDKKVMKLSSSVKRS